MKTFLYDTNLQERIGPIRDGYYTIDGVRPELPENIIEITIVVNPDPVYDNTRQRLEYRERLDIANKQLIKEKVIVNLTQQEIDDIIQSQIPKPPRFVTPRQFRLGIKDFGLSISTIEGLLNAIPDETERERALIEWEYSTEIDREHPLIQNFARVLNISETDLDNIFWLADEY